MGKNESGNKAELMGAAISDDDVYIPPNCLECGRDDQRYLFRCSCRDRTDPATGTLPPSTETWLCAKCIKRKQSTPPHGRIRITEVWAV